MTVPGLETRAHVDTIRRSLKAHRKRDETTLTRKYRMTLNGISLISYVVREFRSRRDSTAETNAPETDVRLESEPPDDE